MNHLENERLSKKAHKHRLSGELGQLANLCHGTSITLRLLTEAMGTRAEALLVFLLALPFLLPIPLVGLSIFFGVCIAIVGTRMALGKSLWFPKKWMDRPLSATLFHKIFDKGGKIVRWFEVWIKPRGHFFHRYSWIRNMNGFMIAICGFFLALPLPPGTNFPPAVAIVLLATGSLEEDGVFLGLGYIAFLLNLVFFGLLPFLGIQGVRAVWA